MTGRTPVVTLIAALAHERIIGRDNALPWHLPADLAHFKRHTLDKPILMGRRTWESLPGLLPRRRHVVVSRNPDFAPPQCTVAASPEAALKRVEGAPEVMVIGGASLYQALLPRADRLILTLIDADIEGDVRFPRWDPRDWHECTRAHRARDAANPFDLDFVILQRVRD